jgi:hypothetical protein
VHPVRGRHFQDDHRLLGLEHIVQGLELLTVETIEEMIVIAGMIAETTVFLLAPVPQLGDVSVFQEP